MNKAECKLSKPMSEVESQPSPQPAEVTGPELWQESTSSQPETCDLPLFPSSVKATSASGNKTKKTSPEGMPEFVVDAKLTPFSSSSSKTLPLIAAKTVTKVQNSCLPSSSAGTSSELICSDQSHSESLKAALNAKLTEILRSAFSFRLSKKKQVGEKKSSLVLATELCDSQATPKSEEVTFKSPYKCYEFKLTYVIIIPATTDPGAAYYVPKWMIEEYDNVNPSDEQAKFTEIIKTAHGNKGENESSTNLANCIIEEWIERDENSTINVPAHELQDIKKGSSSTSSELHDSQLPPEYLHFNLNLTLIDFPIEVQCTEPGAKYYVPESMIHEWNDLMAKRTPKESFHEPEPRQTE